LRRRPCRRCFRERREVGVERGKGIDGRRPHAQQGVDEHGEQLAERGRRPAVDDGRGAEVSGRGGAAAALDPRLAKPARRRRRRWGPGGSGGVGVEGGDGQTPERDEGEPDGLGG
ncbi:unnamed protein product, partial [Ectocarpus sp. 4 AP-2014]